MRRAATFGPETGRRLLWLHGWMGNAEEGRDLQSYLGDGVQLVCPDLPGHGSCELADWDLNAVMERIAELAGETAGALGYSLGGRLLMMAAARFPNHFDKMVIESAHPGLMDPQQRTERRQVDAARARDMRDLGLEAFCGVWYRAPMWGGAAVPRRQGDPEELAGALERFSLARQPDLRPWLRRCGNRLLWLAGSRDQAYAELAVWVYTNTPHRVVLLDAGHNVHAQCPEEWAEQIRRYFDINGDTEAHGTTRHS